MATNTKKVRNRLVDSAGTDSKRIHITPRFNGWAVRKEGNFLPTRIIPNQKDAILFAKDLIRKENGSLVVVHSKDGRFRLAK